jgi:hypothetical protein
VKFYWDDKIKEDDIGWTCNTHEINENCIVGKTEGKRQLCKSRRR